MNEAAATQERRRGYVGMLERGLAEAQALLPQTQGWRRHALDAEIALTERELAEARGWMEGKPRCSECGNPDAPWSGLCSRCAADERGTDYSELHDEFSYEEEA